MFVEDFPAVYGTRSAIVYLQNPLLVLILSQVIPGDTFLL